MQVLRQDLGIGGRKARQVARLQARQRGWELAVARGGRQVRADPASMELHKLGLTASFCSALPTLQLVELTTVMRMAAQIMAAAGQGDNSSAVAAGRRRVGRRRRSAGSPVAAARCSRLQAPLWRAPGPPGLPPARHRAQAVANSGQQEGREVQRGGVDCPTRCGALGPAICPPGAGQRGTLRRRQRGRLTAGGLPPAARAESLLIPAILTTMPVLYNQPCPRHVKQFRSPLLQALLPCLVRPFANQPAVFLFAGFANRLCQPSLCLCLRFIIGYITQTR